MKRATAFALVAFGLSTAGHTQTLTTCIPDHGNLPFSTPTGEADWQRVVAQAAQRLGYVVRYMPAPWPRCLAGIRVGDYDAVLGPEPDTEYADFIALPEKAGQLDTARRLGTVDYVLVQRSTAVPAWDRSRQVRPTMVIPRSIAAIRLKLGATSAFVKSINYDANRFIALLCQDRADAVVVRRNDLPALNSPCETEVVQIGRSQALASADVYLGVRKALLSSRQDLAEALWREIGKVRTSSRIGD